MATAPSSVSPTTSCRCCSMQACRIASRNSKWSSTITIFMGWKLNGSNVKVQTEESHNASAVSNIITAQCNDWVTGFLDNSRFGLHAPCRITRAFFAKQIRYLELSNPRASLLMPDNLVSRSVDASNSSVTLLLPPAIPKARGEEATMSLISFPLNFPRKKFAHATHESNHTQF